MAVIQVNPDGMAATAPGYISSITIYTGGAATVLVPNAATGEVTVDALAATHLVQAINSISLVKG